MSQPPLPTPHSHIYSSEPDRRRSAAGPGAEDVHLGAPRAGEHADPVRAAAEHEPPQPTDPEAAARVPEQDTDKQGRQDAEEAAGQGQEAAVLLVEGMDQTKRV